MRNTESETNHFAAELFGDRIENLGGSSRNVGSGLLSRGASSTLSGTEQYRKHEKPDDFISLATPSLDSGIDYANLLAYWQQDLSSEWKRCVGECIQLWRHHNDSSRSARNMSSSDSSLVCDRPNGLRDDLRQTHLCLDVLLIQWSRFS